MKKSLLLSLVALAAVLVACGSKYVGECETLCTSYSAKLDSVTTIEQYNQVSADYAVATGELQAKYGEETLSAEESAKIETATAAVNAKFEEIKAKVTPVIDTLIDTTVVEAEVVEVK